MDAALAMHAHDTLGLVKASQIPSQCSGGNIQKFSQGIHVHPPVLLNNRDNSLMAFVSEHERISHKSSHAIKRFLVAR